MALREALEPLTVTVKWKSASPFSGYEQQTPHGWVSITRVEIKKLLTKGYIVLYNPADDM